MQIPPRKSQLPLHPHQQGWVESLQFHSHCGYNKISPKPLQDGGKVEKPGFPSSLSSNLFLSSPLPVWEDTSGAWTSTPTQQYWGTLHTQAGMVSDEICKNTGFNKYLESHSIIAKMFRIQIYQDPRRSWLEWEQAINTNTKMTQKLEYSDKDFIQSP